MQENREETKERDKRCEERGSLEAKKGKLRIGTGREAEDRTKTGQVILGKTNLFIINCDSSFCIIGSPFVDKPILSLVVKYGSPGESIALNVVNINMIILPTLASVQ